MGLGLATDLTASPVVGLDLLVPPGANCQTTLVSLVSSLDPWLLHFMASKPPSHQLIQLDICRCAHTDTHPFTAQSSPKKAASSRIKNLFHLQLLKSHLSGALLQRSLEQELPCAYSI